MRLFEFKFHRHDWLDLTSVSALGPEKFRNFSSLFRVPQFPLLSSQKRGPKQTNFAILLVFKPSRLKFDNWLFGPESSRDFGETGPTIQLHAKIFRFLSKKEDPVTEVGTSPAAWHVLSDNSGVIIDSS